MTEFQFETPQAAEAFELMMHLFEDRIDSAGMARLDLELRQDASVRRLFVRVAHQYCAMIPFIAAGGQQESLDDAPMSLALSTLSETMILPALREVDTTGTDEDSEDESFQPAPFQLPNLNSRSRTIRWGHRIAIVLVLALLVSVAVFVRGRHPGPGQQAIHQPFIPPALVVQPQPPPATITAIAQATVVGGNPINPRTDLVVGSTLDLTGGDVELTFATGATVVVRGPARVRLTDRTTLSLDTGTVYAHVPPSAIGFRILAPGLGVVDRGTNFGVRITPGENWVASASAVAGGATGTDNVSGHSTSEVHVFEGHVDATALDVKGNASSPPMSVKAGEAVSHSALLPDAPLASVRFQANAFDQDINRLQLDVPSHGTGAGLEAGSPDPLWQLISVPNATDAKPAATFVIKDPRPEYVPNSAKAKWISTSPQMANVPGGDYVYRTTIDLTGFDPASVSVVANFAVDDKIREIRVNGRAASLPRELTMGLDGGPARTTLHQLPLSNIKWVSGPNQVDVVVWNLEGYDNFTGLQLGWSISAAPIVMR